MNTVGPRPKGLGLQYVPIVSYVLEIYCQMGSVETFICFLIGSDLCMYFKPCCWTFLTPISLTELLDQAHTVV